MKTNAKVSIIVPCYNVSNYITNCLDCLTKQTLENIEIICIDDKSSDDTLKKIRNYIKTSKDKRIKIIAQKKNGGVANARNAGLENAKGEYIGFCDPDDLVDMNFYEVLYKNSDNGAADIVKGISTVIKLDGHKEIVDTNDLIKQNKFNHNGYFWSAIYKKDLLKKNGILFPKNFLISEDLVFLIQAVSAAKKISLTNKVSYFYYRRENSLDSEMLSSEKLKSGVQATQYMLNFANDLENITATDYDIILKQVRDLANYLSGKKLSCKADKEQISNLFIWIYKNTKNKESFKRIFKKRIYKAVKNNDLNRIYKILFTKNVVYKLFNILPLFKVSYFEKDYIKISLLSFIPAIKIKLYPKKKKIFIFGLLILVIKG